MANTFRLASIGLMAVLLSACADDSALSGAGDSISAADIHKNALVLDAHADIEIPGKEDRYAGADGKSKVEPSKMRAGGVGAVGEPSSSGMIGLFVLKK